MVDAIDFGSRGLTIDDEPQGMPITLDRLRLVLGEPRVSEGEPQSSYAWDLLGLSARFRNAYRYSEWFCIHTVVGKAGPFRQHPPVPFRGTFTVDEVDISQVPFRVGHGGWEFAFVGPYAIGRWSDADRGTFYECSVTVPGLDYFAPPKAG